jgi:hypothetical protein
MINVCQGTYSLWNVGNVGGGDYLMMLSIEKIILCQRQMNKYE